MRVIFSLAIQIIGAAGVPDDLETWQRWIDAIMHDPVVNAWAERAVEVAEIVNTPWVRGGLFAVGLLVLLWSTRPVWRIRHRIKFRWRKVLSSEVWISREDALDLIKESDWAQARRPATFRPIIDFGLHVRARDPEAIKFRAFIYMALDNFEEYNSHAVREVGESKEYEETALRDYLYKALEQDAQKQFGSLPNIRTE